MARERGLRARPEGKPLPKPQSQPSTAQLAKRREVGAEAHVCMRCVDAIVVRKASAAPRRAVGQRCPRPPPATCLPPQKMGGGLMGMGSAGNGVMVRTAKMAAAMAR